MLAAHIDGIPIDPLEIQPERLDRLLCLFDDRLQLQTAQPAVLHSRTCHGLFPQLPLLLQVFGEDVSNPGEIVVDRAKENQAVCGGLDRVEASGVGDVGIDQGLRTPRQKSQYRRSNRQTGDRAEQRLTSIRIHLAPDFEPIKGIPASFLTVDLPPSVPIKYFLQSDRSRQDLHLSIL
jgi:hypothetical protein